MPQADYSNLINRSMARPLKLSPKAKAFLAQKKKEAQDEENERKREILSQRTQAARESYEKDPSVRNWSHYDGRYVDNSWEALLTEDKQASVLTGALLEGNLDVDVFERIIKNGGYSRKHITNALINQSLAALTSSDPRVLALIPYVNLSSLVEVKELDKSSGVLLQALVAKASSQLGSGDMQAVIELADTLLYTFSPLDENRPRRFISRLLKALKVKNEFAKDHVKRLTISDRRTLCSETGWFENTAAWWLNPIQAEMPESNINTKSGVILYLKDRFNQEDAPWGKVDLNLTPEEDPSLSALQWFQGWYLKGLMNRDNEGSAGKYLVSIANHLDELQAVEDEINFILNRGAISIVEAVALDPDVLVKLSDLRQIKSSFTHNAHLRGHYPLFCRLSSDSEAALLFQEIFDATGGDPDQAKPLISNFKGTSNKFIQMLSALQEAK